MFAAGFVVAVARDVFVDCLFLICELIVPEYNLLRLRGTCCYVFGFIAVLLDVNFRPQFHDGLYRCCYYYN